ncbi:MAG: tetratricopeptide repeat protein [Chloroflexota bacterium]|nr:tetratricopeptide repeat protein [Chloroflexota bacterium]
MAAPRGGIPVPESLTSLVGREREIARVGALLRRPDVRLMTLTGPGGVGKTRLAVAAASSVEHEFAADVRFVPLAEVRDPRLVAQTLAQALDIPDPGTRPFAGAAWTAVGETETLLLVDNFEHLLAAAPLLSELLVACPRLTLLVTSRERLRLSGEWDVPVLPLACPAVGNGQSASEIVAAPAVTLFVERARALSPEFALTDGNAAAVAAICHRLDGLPLALELAAARGPHLSPAALLARLAYRLPLLTGGPRDAPERLRTMRDAIAWSYDLLSAQDRALFSHVAVFASGFTLDAAAAIAAAAGWGEGKDDLSTRPPSSRPSVLDGISSLVDKNLMRRADLIVAVQREWRGEGDAEQRYELLETIRDFGLERLAVAGEANAVRSAQANYYRALADEAMGAGSLDQSGLDRLDTDLANFRVALTWSCEGGSPATALRLATRLGPFWRHRGHHREGLDWIERALALSPNDDPAARSAALSVRADLLRDLGNHTGAIHAFTRARELAMAVGDQRAEATAMMGLAAMSDDVGENVATKELALLSAVIWREVGDRSGLARALHTLGWAEAGMGQTAVATRLFRESLGHARAAADARAIAHILGSLGNLLAEQGQFSAARPLLEECLAMARATRDEAEVADAAADLGWLELGSGETASAHAAFAECLDLSHGTGRRRVAVFAIEGCAVLAAIAGESDRASRLVAAAFAMREEMELPAGRDPRLIATHPASARHRYWHMATTTPDIGRVWSMDEALREAGSIASPPHRPGVAGAADPVARYGLTPRETDVLRLLVAGRPDRAIADDLFISRRTASKHVAAILAKLGAASRTEAATRALRDGFA